MSVDTKHYNFTYKLTEQEKEDGVIRVDPYFLAKQWKLGEKDDTGCLFHLLKNIARFGVKEGNSVTREISGFIKTAERMKQLYTVEPSLFDRVVATMDPQGTHINVQNPPWHMGALWTQPYVVSGVKVDPTTIGYPHPDGEKV